MLRTRLWMGAVLIALTVGVLVVDDRLAPVYPFLLFLLLVLSVAACVELLFLILPGRRPSPWLCIAAVVALLLANWVPHLAGRWDAWHAILGTFVAVVLAAFLAEMAAFQAPGDSVVRVALTVLVAAYLGLLPCFLAQLRWSSDSAPVSLALAIFVPKCCDIGAYFTGRFLGRHPMAPVLSPKKTWEGAVGGLALSAAAAVGINRLGPALVQGLGAEIGFGLTVGAAGMLGDLAESLVKRDLQHKDASQVVPGFGGVLDVVDSIIFAAPVSYCWLRLLPLAA